MSGGQILQTIQELARGQFPDSEDVRLVYGIVMTTAPLSVRIDDKITIPADLIVLTPLCEKMVIDTGYIDMPTIGLWRGLQIGDKVAMLRTAKAQQYVAFYRVDMAAHPN